MDHAGEFLAVALFNWDAKALSVMPLFSDIHLMHPYLKTCRVAVDRPDGAPQLVELPVLQVNEPETVYINMINMKGTAVPSEFSNKVFSN